MTAQKLGLKECVSIALGGMIGGGIFAVLGVVAQIVGNATWFAFVLAGIVALCAAVAYNQLNSKCGESGGSVTFVRVFTGLEKVAGMTGWTMLFGYIGSMAMYAYAFGSFAVGFAVIPDDIAGFGTRPLVSVLAVGFFVWLNLLGAKSTGMAENVMVAAKVVVLLVLGIGGIAWGYQHDQLVTGASELIGFSPIEAAAISFVAFQGWQLLYYDQESIANPAATIRRAVYIAIPTAVFIYIVVAVTTLSLAPSDIVQTHPERALAVAAEPFLPYGFVIISIAALFSTGSAINATLFSSGYFAKAMLANDLLPDRAGDSSVQGLPRRTVVLLGGITALLAAIGTLGAITSFASLAFILVFGWVCAIAVRRRDSMVAALAPALGALGSILFFVLMIAHLYANERSTFYTVIGIAVVSVAVELLYFNRKMLKFDPT